MSAIVNVPKPCHASWEKMHFANDGRHCKACDQVVIDFSRMEDAEIIAWLREKKGEKVCGQFRSDQVKRLEIIVKPAELRNMGWSQTHYIQVAIFLVFFSSLFSCTPTTATDGAIPEIIIQTETRSDTTHKKNLPARDDLILGDITMPTTTCQPGTQVKDTLTKPIKEHFLKGEVAYIPDVKVDTLIQVPPKNTFIRGKVAPAYGTDRSASFPGGEKVLHAWLNENKRYPEVNRARMFRGEVVVDAIISTTGQASVAKYISPDPVPDCFQQEVERLLQEMPVWHVATKRGKPISSIVQIRISFHIGD